MNHNVCLDIAARVEIQLDSSQDSLAKGHMPF